MNITTHKANSPKGIVTLYTITNDKGASVTLSTLGAGIVKVEVPDKDGRLADVTLGYEDIADYMADGPCMGKTPGRFANRIAGGHFTLDGKEYQLPLNCGPDTLHGGPEGFMNRNWHGEARGSQVLMTYTSADGEEGFPGEMEASVLYTWTNNNELIIDIAAQSDAKTIVNLTNHAYWNLDGHDAGSVLDHDLKLTASNFLATSDKLIPTGEITPVKGTPLDFTSSKRIGEEINADYPALKYGKGYDNCWVIDNWHKHTVAPVAVLHSSKSGRVLEIESSQPAVQVYTANWMDGCPKGKGGCTYHDYDGVAIECQGFPDAPNHSNFPSQILGPGETYEQRIIYRFKTE